MECTASGIYERKYELLKNPLGLSTLSSQFQRYVYIVYRELLHDSTVVIYMDDFSILSQNEEEGLEKLKLI